MPRVLFFNDTYSILPCCWCILACRIFNSVCLASSSVLLIHAVCDERVNGEGFSYWSWTGAMIDHQTNFLKKNPKEIEHNHNHYNRQCRLATQHTEREFFKQVAFEKFISLTARKPFSEPNLHWCHMKSADLRKTECSVPLALKRCTKREKKRVIEQQAASANNNKKSQRAASANNNKKKIRTPSATRIRQE